jgi:hypothetical protein
VIDARDIIDDAIDSLALGKTSEARQRAVASRAYYAAYHFLLSHACGQPFAVGTSGRKSGFHKQFINWLYQSKDSSVLLVAHKLDSLLDNRVLADYKITKSFSVKFAQDSVDSASEIIDIDLQSYNSVLDKRTYP